jgi:hypothetical protein
VLAGDECAATKSGKQNHRLDRFFPSLFGKPVPGIALFALSLIDTEARRSYPVMAEQVVRTEEEKAGHYRQNEPKDRRLGSCDPLFQRPRLGLGKSH